MKTIDPEIANYIDSSVAKARHEFGLEIKDYKTEIKQYMTDLRNGFREEIKMGFEAFSDRPTKEEVREIFREEMPALVRKELIAIMG
jgi:hypothetical protein